MRVITHLLCFMILSPAAPPDLPSFPTRRSSDLSDNHSCRDAVARVLAHRAAGGLGACSPNTASYCNARARLRSEEHTSELQSLRHLVCRLLLEKKKKNTNKATLTEYLTQRPHTH